MTDTEATDAPSKLTVRRESRRPTSSPSAPKTEPMRQPRVLCDRQSEGRRRQDHDRHQSRHRARRDRREGADRRSRSAGQRLDRPRHRPAQTARCSTYDVLIGEAPLRDAILATAVPRLHIAASTLDLSGLELEIGTARDRAFRLAQCARRAEQRRRQRLSPMCWSIVRRRSICSPSMRWRRRMRSSFRCNASSSRSKVCRNCSRPSSR